jgi:hypothetical protein
MTGTGANPANLTISPSPHSFGTVSNGSTSAAQTFTITNTGGVPSGTISTSLGGANPNQFTKSADGCNGQALAAGASCTVGAAFAPTSSGAKGASMSVAATPGGSASASLSGTGQAPANLTISPTSHSFGNVLQGTTSPAKQFTVTNTGEQAATLTSITGVAKFTLASTCPGTLPGGASCTIDVEFAPGAADTGSRSGNVTVNASVGGTVSTSVSGTAVTTAANLEISSTWGGSTSAGPYGSSTTFSVGSTGFPVWGSVVSFRVWIRNSGAADARISNSPVPITKSNLHLYVFGTGTNKSTCPGIAENDNHGVIEFTELVIPGGSECYIAMAAGKDSAGPASSASFTITGSPGGSITATAQD